MFTRIRLTLLPLVLFNSVDIVERINKHPMAIWKTKIRTNMKRIILNFYINPFVICRIIV